MIVVMMNMSNRQVDSYLIQDRLPDGGMSMVFKAYDTHRQQDVVLKVLHDRYLDHREVTERFRREIELAKELHHTHIVPFFGFGEMDGKPYMALKFMPGGSLSDQIKRGRPPLKNVARWLVQVASALDYAHWRGVIHRDIKPGNVLLDANGDASLSDFGIAHVADATQLTRTDMAMPGTARFMSPEQAVGKVIDARSDIYSLAVLTYVMVVGDYPFDGPNEVSIILQHVDKAPPRPSARRPDLPRALDRVILKGMAKKPHQRYRSAGEFAHAFAEAVDAEPNITTGSASTLSKPIPPRPFSGRYSAPNRPPLVWLLLAGLAGIFGIGVFTVIAVNLLDAESESPVVVEVTETPMTDTPTPAAIDLIPSTPQTALTEALMPKITLEAIATQTPARTVMTIFPSVTLMPTEFPLGMPPEAILQTAALGSPTATLEAPNGWNIGTRLYVQVETGIRLFVGAEAVNAEQFAPGDIVTVARGQVEGGNVREWYGGEEDRWWYVIPPEGASGWLPEDALGEDPPAPSTPTNEPESPHPRQR